MTSRRLSSLAALVMALSLAACGGGSSGPPVNSGGGGGGNTVGNLSITTTSMSFSGPGAPAQSFTVNTGTATGPAIDNAGCAPVATFTLTAAPGTYSVTPTGNGSCTLVVRFGFQTVTLGITVGGSSGGQLSSVNPVNLVVGGPAGSATVSASSGTISADATACNGVAAVTGSGGASPQTFAVAPLAVGSCTFAIVDGSSAVLVPVVVNSQSTGPNALFLSPSSLTFATRSDPPQNSTLSFTGSVGPITYSEDDCIGNTGKPKIAFFTLAGVQQGQTTTLPATITVTPYGPNFGSGTCQIVFTPQTGSPAVLTVTVNP